MPLQLNFIEADKLQYYGQFIFSVAFTLRAYNNKHGILSAPQPAAAKFFVSESVYFINYFFWLASSYN